MKKTVKQNLNSLVGVPVMSSSHAEVEDLSVIKEILLLQKSEILNRDLDFKTSQISSEKCSDDADSTAQEVLNNVSIQLHERERKSLVLIDKALSKFADHTYGLCETCSDDIGFKRLMARPLATLCIACMEETEKANRHGPYVQ